MYVYVFSKFWALLGDDIRILTTNRPADIVLEP